MPHRKQQTGTLGIRQQVKISEEHSWKLYVVEALRRHQKMQKLVVSMSMDMEGTCSIHIEDYRTNTIIIGY